VAGVLSAWLTDVRLRARRCTLPVMTAWIVLSALTALSTLALRNGRPKAPLPREYDGERQLAELPALVVRYADLRRAYRDGAVPPPEFAAARTVIPSPTPVAI
jgi:hypothetical protein